MARLFGEEGTRVLSAFLLLCIGVQIIITGEVIRPILENVSRS
jgi:hypothetical protein